MLEKPALSTSKLNVVLCSLVLTTFVLFIASFVGRGVETRGCTMRITLEQHDSGSQDMRIPRILHQVFLSGRDAYLDLANDPSSEINVEWSKWCQVHHEGWQYKFWDYNDTIELLEKHYPWFLPTYTGYTHYVQRADAIRPFIMHAIGGLYLDLDVECFRTGEDMLEGYDVVLQGTSKEDEPLTNAMMASVPGHPLWEAAFQVLQDRYVESNSSKKSIVWQTGPRVMDGAMAAIGITEAKHLENPENPLVGEHAFGSTKIRVYDQGEWYSPCWWNDVKCHTKLVLGRAAGIASVELVGYHRYTTTWSKGSYGNPGAIHSVQDVQQAMAASLDERPDSSGDSQSKKGKKKGKS